MSNLSNCNISSIGMDNTTYSLKCLWDWRWVLQSSADYIERKLTPIEKYVLFIPSLNPLMWGLACMLFALKMSVADKHHYVLVNILLTVLTTTSYSLKTGKVGWYKYLKLCDIFGFKCKSYYMQRLHMCVIKLELWHLFMTLNKPNTSLLENDFRVQGQTDSTRRRRKEVSHRRWIFPVGIFLCVTVFLNSCVMLCHVLMGKTFQML